ncbi:iron uptake porin [Leptolyngbya sp. 'hensonii']|uniref:iron uptake porin n=1 Tax=Leptolyngbya sp. 'hensonii' TaxID=1922337 RepID=UPI00094FC50F|nr:iron uptake porin [Leptolyngbya sp. 'hensonii']
MRVAPAIAGVWLVSTQGAIADPAPKDTYRSVAEINQMTNLDAPVSSADGPDASMQQLNSVSQLSDVQPSDWAFQALQSLVERYGCVAGYPDGTYRGSRAMTRYEFAAGLNACMDRVNELIASATANLVTKEDLETLRRLQEEFAAELATLRGRVDALEARTATLEAQQFSTTTKLSGLVWFNITGAGSPGTIQAEGVNIFNGGQAPGAIPPVRSISQSPSITFSSLAWLTLTTSFSGKDSLVTQLAVGNGISPANTLASAGLFNTFGVPFTDQTAFVNTGGFLPGEGIGANTSVIIHDLFYRFPVTDTLQVIAGPRVNWYRHFDDNRYTFFLFGASTFNSIGSTLTNGLDRGSGAVVSWKPSSQFQFNVGYLGAEVEFLPFAPFNSASNPQQTQGLFGGLNTLTAELTFTPVKQFNLRLLYNRTNIGLPPGGGVIGTEPIYGFAADTVTTPGFINPLGNATADTFGINFDLEIAKWVGIFGRYGFANTDLFRPNGLGRAGSITAQAYQIGLAFPDLGKAGAVATFSFLVPYTVTSGRNLLISGGGNGGKQYEFEFTYFYPVSDNIALVPAFYIIAEPNNFSNNPPIYVGNLRTQFSF